MTRRHSPTRRVNPTASRLPEPLADGKVTSLTRQEVLDALTAERYGPSLWWHRPEPADSDIATAERRRILLREVGEHDREQGGAA